MPQDIHSCQCPSVPNKVVPTPNRCNSRLRRAAAAAALAVAGVLAMELALGSQHGRRLERQRRAVAAAWGRDLERRREADIVRDLSAAGTMAVPSVTPYVVILRTGNPGRPNAWNAPLFPLAGVSHRPTVQLCDDQGWRPVVGSDDFGFGNPPGLWVPGQVDLALLGDSFTQGYCVAGDSSYPALLRQAWPRTLNLGMGGNGPLAELATLLEYAAPMRPAVVVWQFYENDLADLTSEAAVPALARYLDPRHRQGLMSRQGEVDSLLLDWISRVYRTGQQVNPVDDYRFRTALRFPTLSSWLRRPPPGQAPSRPSLELLGTIWARAMAEVAGWNGRFLVVMVPSWSRYFGPAEPGDGAWEAVARVADSLAIPVLDLDPLLRQQGPLPDLFSRRDIAHGHFSERGYQAMAGAVRDFVTSSGWLVAPGMQGSSPD